MRTWPNNIVPVDGLKFTINEHIQDDEKYVDYDPNEDFNEIDNDDDEDYLEDVNDSDWTVSVYKSETKSLKRKSNSRNLVTKKLKRNGSKSQSIDKTLPGEIKPSNKTKCQAIIEPITDENEMLSRKRAKSKFSGLVAPLHIHALKMKNIPSDYFFSIFLLLFKIVFQENISLE